MFLQIVWQSGQLEVDEHQLNPQSVYSECKNNEIQNKTDRNTQVKTNANQKYKEGITIAKTLINNTIFKEAISLKRRLKQNTNNMIIKQCYYTRWRRETVDTCARVKHKKGQPHFWNTHFENCKLGGIGVKGRVGKRPLPFPCHLKTVAFTVLLIKSVVSVRLDHDGTLTAHLSLSRAKVIKNK